MFLFTFRWQLWISIGLAIIVFGMMLYLFSLLSPYGYKGRYLQRYNETDDTYEEEQDNLDCRAAFWSAAGSSVGGVRYIRKF